MARGSADEAYQCHDMTWREGGEQQWSEGRRVACVCGAGNRGRHEGGWGSIRISPTCGSG